MGFGSAQRPAQWAGHEVARTHTAGRHAIKDSVLVQWHEVAKRRDVAGLDDLLADDVVFHSPVVHTAQRGKQITQRCLRSRF
jgi:ketosteroid isomerase-like protein